MKFQLPQFGRGGESLSSIRVNNSREIAEQILQSKREIYDAATVLNDDGAYVPRIARWKRLISFERRATIAATEEALRRASGNWLHSDAGEPLAFAVVHSGDELQIHYGGGEIETAMVERFPSARLADSAPLDAPYRFNGAILTSGALDFSLVAAAGDALRDSYAACIIEPLSNSDLRNILKRDEEIAGELKPFISTREFDGNEHRVLEVDVPKIREAFGLIQEEIERIQGHGSFRYALVRFGANSRETFERLRSLIRRSARRQEEGAASAVEDFHCYTVAGNPHPLAVPLLRLGMDGMCAHAFMFQDVDDALAMSCTPPLKGGPGYFPLSLGEAEHDGDVFPLAPPAAGLEIGQIHGAPYAAAIPKDVLTAHCAVFGSPGSGKSSTVRAMLLRLHQAGVPFLLIEPFKKEHAAMLRGHIPSLRVYGSDRDARPLEIHPFEPEEGVRIRTHAADMAAALFAAGGGESPLPVALEECCVRIYERRGWKPEDIYHGDSGHACPDLTDLNDVVEEVVAEYAREVRTNLRAALRMRISVLRQFSFGSGKGVRASELLSAPTVVELQDFDSKASLFLTLLLLSKLQAYMTTLPPTGALRGLVVLEEAHRVFTRTRDEDGVQYLANRKLDELLAEARATGIGVMVIDQRPSILSDAVLADTAVRVIHRVASGRDMAALREALMLTADQAAQINRFKPGEGVLDISGMPAQRIRTTLPPPGTKFSAACLLCEDALRCRKARAAEILRGRDPAEVQMYVARALASPYDAAAVASSAEALMAQLGASAEPPAVKLCVLGAALFDVDLGLARVLIASYKKYLTKAK